MVRPAFDVARLTVAERVELIEALWDSLRTHADVLLPSEADLVLIEERRAEHRRTPEAAIPWETVRAELLADQEADERATQGEATQRGV